MTSRTGISNREMPEQEAWERAEHPPQNTGSPELTDAAGRVGEETSNAVPDRQTSHKAGSRSIAQKEDAVRVALGANRWGIARDVATRAAVQIGAGVLLGLPVRGSAVTSSSS